jgi:hypothetical protein
MVDGLDLFDLEIPDDLLESVYFLLKFVLLLTLRFLLHFLFLLFCSVDLDDGALQLQTWLYL